MQLCKNIKKWNKILHITRENGGTDVHILVYIWNLLNNKNLPKSKAQTCLRHPALRPYSMGENLNLNGSSSPIIKNHLWVTSVRKSKSSPATSTSRSEINTRPQWYRQQCSRYALQLPIKGRNSTEEVWEGFYQHLITILSFNQTVRVVYCRMVMK